MKSNEEIMTDTKPNSFKKKSEIKTYNESLIRNINTNPNVF